MRLIRIGGSKVCHLWRKPLDRNIAAGHWKQYHSENGVFGHNPHGENLIQRQPDFTTKDQNRSNAPKLVTAFREHGHRIAQIDPLGCNDDQRDTVLEILQERYSPTEERYVPEGVLHLGNDKASVSVSDGVKQLKETYTNKVGYEFMYIEDELERDWFAQRVEQLASEKLEESYKVQIALEMAKSQNFDHFLAKKFQSVKRYGGEGCESMMAFFLELIKSSPSNQVDHIILGMAHRGRLNLLTGLLEYPPVKMFQKMKGMPEFPSDALATGDVLSHLFTSVDINVEGGGKVRVGILPNPSHLEAVNPVAVGNVRGKLKTLKSYDYSNGPIDKASRVLCVQVHGDAALAGQGINQETLGFAYVPHFRVGGSLHLVVNNQLGYTTPANRARSSRYTTDVAKMILAPVIHVNGDYPEELAKATRLAMEYRAKFHKDVFIDLICFRRWGHNELDDPTFTNPQLYDLISSRKSIPDAYCENLISTGVLTDSILKDHLSSHNNLLNDNFEQIETHEPQKSYLQAQWNGLIQAQEEITTWDTGVDIPLLQYIGVKSVHYPTDFNVHSHLLKTFIKARIAKATTGTKIDWATAEAMALGSLLYQGFGVRLSGEDVGRGTFSQRHAMLVDQKSGQIFIPLNSMVENQEEKLEVCNSTLSEEAVLGFEYGFSIENPGNLVIWEAQFGDFFNGAQIQIDTLLASGETKWMLQSGLVMLLPHGMDGAGPEHSSCRIERFLQMTDSNEDGKADGDYNSFQVVNPTTPAQYFHLLRRQMIRNFRKPMVVIAPKVLLRLPAATSTIEELGPDTFFKPVLDDETSTVKSVKKLVFVSGRHFYTLKEKQVELNRQDIALIRLESLCPFPSLELQRIVKKYTSATEFVWSQEEHQNMGAWSFVKPRFENFVGRRIRYVGRGPLAAPAVGVGKVHHKEVAKLISDTFAQ
ncbi:hypothetical protein Fcan01_22563 [Folsomia candida]|uniref:Transketolase-like pyrimidine-binding domain-containing protein n=1 Tax=Folsomia candida TaxID=158441 RepID=A0A226DC11_FOLCA|nr:hypothetical protein Fcan01_22563 [Folsomia candida]